MKILHKLMPMMLLLGVSAAHAEDVKAVELSAVEEVAINSCRLASHGAYEAAVERQAGSDKKHAKKVLEKEFKKVKKNFKDKEFVEFIESAWFKSLDIVYDIPIQNTEASKKAFVGEAMHLAFISCLDDVQR